MAGALILGDSGSKKKKVQKFRFRGRILNTGVKASTQTTFGPLTGFRCQDPSYPRVPSALVEIN